MKYANNYMKRENMYLKKQLDTKGINIYECDHI